MKLKRLKVSGGSEENIGWRFRIYINGNGKIIGTGSFDFFNLKGNYPWNKYLSGIHLSPKSEFKQGHTPWTKGKSKENNETIRKRFSEDRMGELNPMYGTHHICNTETKKKIGEKNRINTKQFLIDNPDKRKMGFMKNKSVHQNQIRLLDMVSSVLRNRCIYLEFCPEKSSRILDIAVPSLKLDIEHDDKNHFYSRGKNKDIRRDRELKEIGWRVLRITEDEFPTLTLSSLQDRVEECLLND